MTNAITHFNGKNRFLSNFWPCLIVYESIEYPSTEHAFQAAKSLITTERFAVAAQSTPGKAKAMGRQITLRPDWQEVKIQVMKDVLKLKFASPFEGLGVDLKDTGDAELIEGNTWGDKIWGVCDGEGENLLGKLLMERRTELQNLYGQWEGAMEAG